MRLGSVLTTQPRGHQKSRRDLMVRAVRIRWWPRFLVAGVVLAVAGVALFSGVAQFALVVLGALVAMFSAVRGLERDDYYRHEPPVPPGGTGGPT
jgi:hypothetical protein